MDVSVMSKRDHGWSRLIGVTTAAILATTVLACGSGGSGESEAATNSKPAQKTADKSAVEMRLIAYRPASLKVERGTMVRWTQQDAGFHTVTSGRAETDTSGRVQTEPDGTYASDRLAKGETFTFAFDDAGVFPYFCEIHPATMRGEIQVS